MKMKLNTKQLSLIVLLLAFICLIFRCIISYWAGYYGTPGSLFFFLAIIQLIQFIIFIVLVIAVMISMAQKTNRLLAVVILIGFIALNGLSHILPSSSDLIMHGMRSRILRSWSLNNLRQLANDFNQLPRLPGYDFFTSGKMYQNQDLARAGLITKYPFLSFLDAPTIIEESNVVHVAGGRPSRGFYITVDGKEIKLPGNLNAHIVRASDDIIFVVEND